MAIKNPIVAEIAYRTWCIDEYGMDAMYLLEGEERSLLVDTGTGVFDLPGLVQTLTDKPLTVVLTHGHVDHAGGMHQFSQVYLHPDDFALANSVDVENRKDYVHTMMGMSGGIYDIRPDNVVEPDSRAELLPLHEGIILHLGKRDVKVLETPGHTPGGLSFLDVRERILISGDACNGNTLLACSKDLPKSSIGDLLRTARKLQEVRSEYDRHYNGHVGYADMVGIMPQPERLVRDCITLCEKLLDENLQPVLDTSNPFVGPCLLARYETLQVLFAESQLKIAE